MTDTRSGGRGWMCHTGPPAVLRAHGDDVRAAIPHVLREAAGDRLIKAILTCARGAIRCCRS